MSDDFFKGIDSKLSEGKAKDQENAEVAEANREFVKQLIPRLVEIASDYAEKCKARGMDASVKSHDYSVTFTLRYKSGQDRTLVGSPQHDMKNKLSFESHWPNDDGKRYKTMPMDWYDETNWADEKYKRLLEKMIEDFVLYADRFGGV